MLTGGIEAAEGKSQCSPGLIGGKAPRAGRSGDGRNGATAAAQAGPIPPPAFRPARAHSARRIARDILVEDLRLEIGLERAGVFDQGEGGAISAVQPSRIASTWAAMP